MKNLNHIPFTVKGATSLQHQDLDQDQHQDQHQDQPCIPMFID